MQIQPTVTKSRGLTLMNTWALGNGTVPVPPPGVAGSTPGSHVPVSKWEGGKPSFENELRRPRGWNKYSASNFPL